MCYNKVIICNNIHDLAPYAGIDRAIEIVLQWIEYCHERQTTQPIRKEQSV